MNYISALSNPQDKISRYVGTFSGRYVNIYPWPVESVVTRLKVVGTGPSGTSPILGSAISAVPDVYWSPITVPLSSGEYIDQTGSYVLDASNLGYLRVDFGEVLSSVSVYVEGYQAGSTYYKLHDSMPPFGQKFTRILTGTASAISSFVKYASPVAWRYNADTENGAWNMTGTNHTYIGCPAKFDGLQINLSSEDFTRSKTYTLEYWNGSAWTSVGGTIYATVSSADNTNLLFHQSGVIKFTAPADWAKTTISGDPYTTYLADVTTNNGTNLTMSEEQFFVRIAPPTPNAEVVPVSSICVFNY